jgi:hypothetical protein
LICYIIIRIVFYGFSKNFEKIVFSISNGKIESENEQNNQRNRFFFFFFLKKLFDNVDDFFLLNSKQQLHFIFTYKFY